jgi:hypothetical protein
MSKKLLSATAVYSATHRCDTPRFLTSSIWICSALGNLAANLAALEAGKTSAAVKSG